MYGDRDSFTGCPFCGGISHSDGCPNAEIEKVGCCELCGDPIYSGDTVYAIDGNMYHTDCFDAEYAKEV
jgi:hypothetical protein